MSTARGLEGVPAAGWMTGPGAQGRARRSPEGLPGPLVVSAGRGRPVLDRHPVADRDVPDVVLPAVHDRGVLLRLVHTAGRAADARGVLLDPEHQLRRARRAAGPPIHHWAADVFVASIMVHMIRHFFTGSCRKPREVKWLIGIVLFAVALVEGLFGYSLPEAHSDAGQGPRRPCRRRTTFGMTAMLQDRNMDLTCGRRWIRTTGVSLVRRIRTVARRCRASPAVSSSSTEGG